MVEENIEHERKKVVIEETFALRKEVEILQSFCNDTPLMNRPYAEISCIINQSLRHFHRKY